MNHAQEDMENAIKKKTKIWNLLKFVTYEQFSQKKNLILHQSTNRFMVPPTSNSQEGISSYSCWFKYSACTISLGWILLYL